MLIVSEKEKNHDEGKNRTQADRFGKFWGKGLQDGWSTGAARSPGGSQKGGYLEMGSTGQEREMEETSKDNQVPVK